MGCPLELRHEGRTIIEVSGNECNRGAKYARQEFSEPRRALSTTVPITGALWERLPVMASSPVLKDRVMQAARAIHALRVKAPVKAGQVLMKDLLGEVGVDVVACRSMGRLPKKKAGSRRC
jgi:CxxC motif-containing protein